MRACSQSGRVRVVHLSSAHRADDHRIFWKECVSLAHAGYEVSFVVPAPAGAVMPRPGRRVEVVGVRRRSGRFGRVLLSMPAVLFAGLAQRGDIYHFHDVELFPAGLLLRLIGKRVIYDAHEDLPRAILTKDWMPGWMLRPVAQAAGAFEWAAARALSGVVAATPVIARRFPPRRTALVQNFAQLSEFTNDEAGPRPDRPTVAYVGEIALQRCAIEMVDALGQIADCPDLRLVMAGDMSPPSLATQLARRPGWSRVDYRGRQDRAGIGAILADACAGLAVFHDVQARIESQPVKLFEYMAAGLPVIASDFPHFRRIIEQGCCGICVAPRDTRAIASAINWILQHPAEAQAMGRRGRELIERSFNWERESLTLLGFYERILGPRRTERWREARVGENTSGNQKR